MNIQVSQIFGKFLDQLSDY